MHKQHSYIVIAAIVFFAAFSAQAQTIGGSIDQLKVIASPETPGPNTEVRLEVQGVGNFVGDSTITWYKDGTVAKTGVGERTYTFTTGNVGEAARIRVVVESATAGTIARELAFVPAQVYLVWEADTSVPPLYRGKALYSAGSNITVSAFPQVVANGATISSNNLSFQWERNGQAVPAQSGKGRATFAFTGEQTRSGEGIRVEVYFGSVRVAEGSLFIPAVKPQILLYPRDPLRGVLFDQALPAAISLGSREITVQAVPYFFATESFADGSLSYAWTLDGNTTTGPDAGRGMLTLRQSGEGSGSARLGVSLQNTDSSKLLQAAETAVRIVFGATSNSNSPFGL